MKTFLTLTILGADRPGLVRALSHAVAEHGGNWLESRMVHLAGQFAGILRIECDESSAPLLLAELKELEQQGLRVQPVDTSAPGGGEPAAQLLHIDVVGHDQPGIVRRLAAAIASAGANVEELTTGLESAPMAGHPLFRASGTVSLPPEANEVSLLEAIENLGGDLSVDISSSGTKPPNIR